MYFYAEPLSTKNTNMEQEYQEKHQEKHQENYEYGSTNTSTSKSMPNWVLPVAAVSIVALVGIWFLLKKKKPSR